MFLLLFCSCFQDDDIDDRDKICEADCTTIKGRFVTTDGEPIEGLGLGLNYKKSGSPFGGGTIRRIRNIVTDHNGYYATEFYILDEELGQNADGYFILPVNLAEINRSKYLIPEGTSIDRMYSNISKRDTVIDNGTYYIPKKSHIKVTLNGFKPQAENDRFEIKSVFPFGEETEEFDRFETGFGTWFSGFDKYLAKGENTVFNKVMVAQNVKNLITVRRTKNGETSIEEHEIFVPYGNNDISLTFEY